MRNEVLSFTALCSTLDSTTYDRPPAIVCNAHITALAVARALHEHGVPVIAVDRSPDGVAPYSKAVDCAGQITYPLHDETGFREDLETLAACLDHDPILFPCMDEWVIAAARSRPDGVRLPFADFDTVNGVLDKSMLYDRAGDLGIPTPTTYHLDRTDPNDAADALGYPFIVKPALKRRFEAAVGTNLVEVHDPDAYHDILTRARDADLRLLAQERVPKSPGDLYTLGSYVPRSGVSDAVTFVGNRQAIYPPDYGTTCLVRTVDAPAVRRYSLDILDATGYYGISEAEFLYDERTDDYLLLDVNTRPWKWIGLPIEAGANLPVAAYEDAMADQYTPDPITDTTWVYLRDYLGLLAESSHPDSIDYDDWVALLSGEFESQETVTTAVYSPSDPGPTYQLLQTEFSEQEYYCAC